MIASEFNRADAETRAELSMCYLTVYNPAYECCLYKDDRDCCLQISTRKADHG